MNNSLIRIANCIRNLDDKIKLTLRNYQTNNNNNNLMLMYHISLNDYFEMLNLTCNSTFQQCYLLYWKINEIRSLLYCCNLKQIITVDIIIACDEIIDLCNNWLIIKSMNKK